jgi:hypothetical protein
MEKKKKRSYTRISKTRIIYTEPCLNNVVHLQAYDQIVVIFLLQQKQILCLVRRKMIFGKCFSYILVFTS